MAIADPCPHGLNPACCSACRKEYPALQAPVLPCFQRQLDAVLADIREFLIRKNTAYGNSALEPVRIFSNADPVEQIRVRIDDKLSRLMKGRDRELVPEDTERDLLGYLVLLQIAKGEP